jgi:hypothetical protein
VAGRRGSRDGGADAVAVLLAVGIATALNVIVVAVLYDAIKNPADAGISENATQILTGWGGGIIGILGAVFGYRAGQDATSTPTRTTLPAEVDDDYDEPIAEPDEEPEPDEPDDLDGPGDDGDGRR